MDDKNNDAATTSAAKGPTSAPARQAEPVVVPVEAAAEPTAVELGVAAWVDSHIRNSVLSRDTVAWNYLVEALKALPAFIEGK